MSSPTFSSCPSQLKATCMLALLDLAALLATRGELSVTVAITAGNAPLLEPLRRACPSIGVATLPFPWSSSAAAALVSAGRTDAENTKDLPYPLFRMFVPSLAALRAPLLSWCRAQRHRVTAIVSDLFTGWTRPLATELGARHVTFSPCSALYVAASRPLWRDMPQPRRRGPAAAAADNDDGEAAVVFPDVIGSPGFPWRQLPTIYRHHRAGDEPSEAIRQILLWGLGSECVVVNSFAALEPAYLAPGSALAPPRVLAVGPLSEAWATSGNRGGKPAVAPAEVAAEGKHVRERAAELGRMAAAAVAEGGSSYTDFQELLRVLANAD